MPENDSPLIRTLAADDGMFNGNAAHYFSVGKSAMECIRRARDAAGIAAEPVNRILDMPCGHGRVQRHLRAAFPRAEITACDLDRAAVDFCAATFSAVPVYSRSDPTRAPLGAGGFDLIWVGSLLTHFDSHRWETFLEKMLRVLAPRGLLLFTTHGRTVWERMPVTDYGLTPDRSRELRARYARTGFAYCDYPGSVGEYGISLSRADWVCRRIARLPARLAWLSESAWDNHHDVYALAHRPSPQAGQPGRKLDSLRWRLRDWAGRLWSAIRG